MNSSEIIKYRIYDESIQKSIINQSIEYALLSIPFTFDRLGNRNLTKNITNIVKGKFAEHYFYQFCLDHQIQLDTSALTTPFYQADQKDFLLKNLEWDIKNNYLQHSGDLLADSDYVKQHALIPNRGPWDQWSKRLKTNHNKSTGTAYLFTFMKKSDLKDKDDLIRLKINLDQKNFLLDLYEHYQGKHQQVSPYTKEEFWDKFFSRGPNYDYEIKEFPFLIITGIATAADFPNFYPIKPSEMKSQYLRTIIENMGLTIESLQSFKEYSNL